jgi:hypothetical protein
VEEDGLQAAAKGSDQQPFSCTSAHAGSEFVAGVAPLRDGSSSPGRWLFMAVAARAELIVTGDRKHLLPIGTHQGIATIVTAREVVGRIETTGKT